MNHMWTHTLPADLNCTFFNNPMASDPNSMFTATSFHTQASSMNGQSSLVMPYDPSQLPKTPLNNFANVNPLMCSQMVPQSHAMYPPFHYSNMLGKRRNSRDEEDDNELQPPTKQCITEEKMMAQMNRLSLGQICEDQEKEMSTTTQPVIEVIDSDDEDISMDKELTLTFSNEVKQILHQEDILTTIAKEELAKPSKALLLWQPQQSFSPYSKIYDAATEGVIIEEIDDDEELPSADVVFTEQPCIEEESLMLDENELYKKEYEEEMDL